MSKNKKELRLTRSNSIVFYNRTKIFKLCCFLHVWRFLLSPLIEVTNKQYLPLDVVCGNFVCSNLIARLIKTKIPATIYV